MPLSFPIRQVANADFPTRWGRFRILAFDEALPERTGRGHNKSSADAGLPAAILQALGLKQVRLLSNNPEKVSALENAGIKVVERVPCEVAPHSDSENYLKTKKEKLGHLFTTR